MYIFFFFLTHSSTVNVSIFLIPSILKFSFIFVLLLLVQGVIEEEGTLLNLYYLERKATFTSGGCFKIQELLFLQKD